MNNSIGYFILYIYLEDKKLLFPGMYSGVDIKKELYVERDKIFQICLDEGWIEQQDIENQDKTLDRRTAARILHEYMRRRLGIKDLEDITQAYELRDLFDCRVCANHIAQVYLRGIIEPVMLEMLKIFDVYGEVTENEIISYVNRTIGMR